MHKLILNATIIVHARFIIDITRQLFCI